ncbi:TIGR02391 family protein [Nocardioides humi]|uniref:TIGR02391 family protein n=1 Tax=Nocardioides humi TaxID=449461 RepID=UPI0015E85D5B|nr:TIGR02391 family protein [Nocardioides humi]
MDTEWAIEQCREWLRLQERVPIPDDEREPHGPKTRARGTKEERNRVGNRVRLVADTVWEKWNNGYRWTLEAGDVRSLIFELEEGYEVRERLGLLSPGPALAADTLHPWVWDAARPHWESDNHDAAVWAAAINVNTQLKAKAERPDLGETKLVQEVFGTSPPEPGKVRLRLCDESNPDLFKDRHIGAIMLGQGLFSGVRNPLNHVGADDLTEQEALETLAAWSLFARWVTQAEVVRGEEPS